MTICGPILASSVLGALKQFVSVTKLHPILVNFTEALVPVSLASDLIGRMFKHEPLRHTGWWTLFFATLITPLTAITGWLFWMGSGLALLLFGLCAWRWKLHQRQRWPGVAYFIVGAIFVAALTYQGHLGGEQVFSGM